MKFFGWRLIKERDYQFFKSCIEKQDENLQDCIHLSSLLAEEESKAGCYKAEAEKWRSKYVESEQRRLELIDTFKRLESGENE